MGIYYYAADDSSKEVIHPPKDFSNKLPWICHPDNPFSNIVCLANCYGSHFEINNDMTAAYEYQCEYEDKTKYYTDRFFNEFPKCKERYETLP